MTRRLIALMLLGGALTPITAHAAPVYLTCMFDNGFETDLAPDEKAGTVALTLVKTGYTEVLDGVFSADKVLFEDSDTRYRLSRIDLTLTRTYHVRGVQVGEPSVSKCRVQKNPAKRAF